MDLRTRKASWSGRDRLPFRLAHGRPVLGPEVAVEQDVKDVQARQDEAGHDGAGKELAHRKGGLVGHDHQHDAGRDQDAERPAGADAARGQALVVVVFQHDGHPEEPHGHHRGADDAGAGAEKGRDHHHRDGQPAPDGTEQIAHGVEEVLGHAGLVQQLGHEDEQRDAHQDVVVHDAPGLVQEHVEGGRPPAQVPEDHGQTAQHKSQGMAHEQPDEQPDEHADGDEFRAHRSFPLAKSWMLRMKLASPWSSSMAKVTGMTVLISGRMVKAAVSLVSPMDQEVWA